MRGMVTLMLVDNDCATALVECPVEGIRPGMIVEYDGCVGNVRTAISCSPGSPVYNFACAMALHQDKPYQATKVYSQCWEACPA